MMAFRQKDYKMMRHNQPTQQAQTERQTDNQIENDTKADGQTNI